MDPIFHSGIRLLLESTTEKAFGESIATDKTEFTRAMTDIELEELKAKT
jgi:citrate lyase gamma subunit